MKSKELQTLAPMMEAMAALARRAQGRGVAAAQDELDRLGTELRKQFRSALASLSETLSEREALQVLFPLVVHIDEIVQTGLVSAEGRWSMLQKELYRTDKGGEVFYQSLDELLDGRQSPAFLCQVYQFCLKLGFRGWHVNNPERIKAYLRRLQERLLPDTEETTAVETAQPLGKLPTHRHPAFLYAGAVAILVLVYLLLGALGRRHEPRQTAPVQTSLVTSEDPWPFS